MLYILDTAKKEKVRHEVYTFESGCTMIDIWVDEKFYVIQIEKNLAGISLVTKETVSFDNIPDHSFKDENSFKEAFEKIFLKS